MKGVYIVFLVLFLLFGYFLFKKENYNHYDTLYQAYTVPYQDLTFISAGQRPALGHYLRVDDDTGFSLYEMST
jgi:hypothetical protein